MAKISVGTFTHWELTNQEVLAGSILTTDQKNLLQNELAQIAEQKLAIEFDSKDPTKFAQNEAFLSGQMSIIRVMLIRSDESELSLLKASQSSSN